jgi:hypothetical protein
VESLIGSGRQSRAKTEFAEIKKAALRGSMAEAMNSNNARWLSGRYLLEFNTLVLR